jgi:ribosome maturation factor RimP
LEQKFLELCRKAVAEAGYDLLRVSWRGKELTFYIDKQGGIGFDDCQTVTKIVEPIVDANDAELGENYSLSVSSSGIDGGDWYDIKGESL